MLKKICNVLSTILLIAMALVAAALLLPRAFGYQELAVLSGSMEPNIHVGAIVLVKEVDFDEIEVGDVITYELSGSTYVTHRVTEIDTTARTLTTQGDANDTADGSPVSETAIVGRADANIPYLGYVSIYMKTPIGIAVICGVLIAVIVLNYLPEVFSGDKSDKAEGEKQEQKKK